MSKTTTLLTMIFGYVMGCHFQKKPLYLIEYWMPGDWNPNVAKTGPPYYEGDEDDRCGKINQEYYDKLYKKIYE